jgi:hypothetical protein
MLFIGPAVAGVSGIGLLVDREGDRPLEREYEGFSEKRLILEFSGE